MNRRKFNSFLAGLGASSVFLPSPSSLQATMPLLASGVRSASSAAGYPIESGPQTEVKLNLAPWYKSPQLFVMTGFIANTTTGVWGPDFIVKGQWSHEKQQAALSEWRKGLGRNYDADETVKSFRDAGATGMIFYAKWHSGLVNYPTKFTSFTTERDLLGDTLNALHKHKMKAVVYYSVGLDYNPDPKFLDWTCRDKKGRPLGLAFPTDWKSFYSPYRQYVINQLVEILKNYGPVDGFWLDLYTQPVVSYDQYTRKAFESKYAEPIEQATPAEAEGFVLDTLQGFLLDIRRSVSAVQPDVGFTWNGSGMDDVVRPQKARSVDGLCDWFSMEGHRLDRIDGGARVGHADDRPHEVGMLLNSSWYVPTDNQAPPAAMSEAEAVVSAATAWIQGANIYAAMTPGHTGVFDRDGDLRLLGCAGKWLKENQSHLADALPYADVGIVVGNPAPDLPGIPLLKDIWKPSHWHSPATETEQPGEVPSLGLRGAGYFTERIGGQFTGRKFNLSSYRMLVLPETALLDGELSSQIREYVRKGGKILGFGHASLFDPLGKLRTDFALGDVFGVKFTGPLPGYKHLVNLPESNLASSMSLNPGAVGVETTTGKSLAVWKGAGNSPAVVENRFGKGQCIYTSAEESEFGEGSPLLGELAGRLVGPPPVTVRAKRKYSLLMNRQGEDLLLYLLDRSTRSRTSVNSPSGRAPELSFPPVNTPEWVSVIVDTGILGEIRRGELIGSNQNVIVSRRLDKIELLFQASPSVSSLRFQTSPPGFPSST
jgi:Alpha-L-fucosidase/Beta-galactosidase trimerisation domain